MLLGFVKCSSHRIKILKAILNEPKTPTAIAKEIGIKRNHMSNVLSELKEKNLAYCVNDEAYKGRYYLVTPIGREMINYIISREK